MKKFLTSIFAVLAFICASSFAYSNILIGNIDNTGSYIITAPQTQLDSIFQAQTIFENWVPSNYEITYDSVTVLYHLQATGNGVGPNLGKKSALRVYISLSGNIFNWGSTPPTGVATSETCTGNPCEYCKFAQGGGGECPNNQYGVCNHTISR